MNSCKKWIKNEININLFPWILILVVFSLASIYVYENRGIFIAPREVEHVVVNQKKAEVNLGELTGDLLLTQSFVSESDQFSRLKLQIGTYGRINQGKIHFSLIEKKSSKVLAKEELDLSTLPDGAYNLNFPTVYQAKGKEYIFSLEGKNLQSGNSFTFWRSSTDYYKSGSLTINGNEQIGDLHFKILNVEMKPVLHKFTFVLIGLLILILFISTFIIIRRYFTSLHKVFLAIAIPFGLIYTVLIPPFDQLDEIEHFYRSFEVSEGKFTNQVVDQKLGNYIPVSLPETVQDVRYVHQEGYKYSLVKEAFSIPLEPDNRVFIRNYASHYPALIYFPQALGMILGRIFFDSPLMMMFFGRLVNFLAYASLVYIALKIVPIKKNLFFVLALLPMAMIHAASLSADAITNASSLLFVSYIFYLAYGNVDKIKNKHIAITILIGIFIALSKIVYVPIIFLFLIIPISKFASKTEFFKKFGYVLIGCLLPFIIWNIMNFSNLSVPDLRINPGVSPSDQVQFVLTHPFHYIKYFIDTLFSQGPSLVIAMIGKASTNYLYQAPSIVVYTFLFMLFIFGMINEKNDFPLLEKRFTRIIMFSIFATIFILTYTALYVGFNTVGNPMIGGVQGRYMIPIVSFFFLSLSSKNIILKNSNLNLLVYTIIHCAMFALLLQHIVDVNS